ncbi:MAG: hypothetical protein R2873_06700 [Caldilineaceae bacterium]
MSFQYWGLGIGDWDWVENDAFAFGSPNLYVHRLNKFAPKTITDPNFTPPHTHAVSFDEGKLSRHLVVASTIRVIPPFVVISAQK